MGNSGEAASFESYEELRRHLGSGKKVGHEGHLGHDKPDINKRSVGKEHDSMKHSHERGGVLGKPGEPGVAAPRHAETPGPGPSKHGKGHHSGLRADKDGYAAGGRTKDSGV
jgi:hypothetical protein